MSKVTCSKVRSLYRELLRAGKISVEADTLKQGKVISKGYPSRGWKPMRTKLELGFKENAKLTDTNRILEEYEKGYNTLNFLKAASDVKSQEHKIVKSLCIMQHYQNSYNIRPPMFNVKLSTERKKNVDEVYDQYKNVVEILNRTANLSLR